MKTLKGIGNCVILQKINCNKNKLATLEGLEGFQNLQELCCYNNQLETLKGLEGCINLRILECERNKLKTLEGLEGCVNLQGNSENFQFGNFVSLQTLNCWNNNLRTLEGLEGCVNLQLLDCSNNKLETLEGIEQCVILQELYCGSNKLEELKGIEGCINLQILSCDNFGNIKNMLNGKEYTFTEELSKYKQVYKRLTLEQMDKYYEYLDDNINNLLEYNYYNFKQSQYFEDHKINLAKKYNLVDFYDELYLITQNTEDECIICMDDTFHKYVKCINGHIICKDCYNLLMNKRLCCVCRVEYEITEMYYSKK